MADGRWQMADDKCRMADGGCRMADDKPAVNSGGCVEGESSESMPEVSHGRIDRGREDRLSSVSPPSEPYWRFSRIRLSSWWSYLEED